MPDGSVALVKIEARCITRVAVNYTVATGVAGDPTAPGSRSGGAVSRNR
jgi:hypothetical protein